MKKITQTCVMAILCLHLTNLFAQNNSTITGTVRNTAGQPLAGASVTNTRTGRGAVTNAAGAFSLHGTQPGDRLRISYIGYAAQTFAPGKETSMIITLKEATSELDKVVVQAYGITSDRLRTGNIGKLTAADIEKQPVMNVLDALQGQMPGVSVTHNNGYASGTIKVEIRGRNMINPAFSSDPLYIIDGVPLTIMDLTGRENYATGNEGAIQSGIPSPAIGQSPLLGINPADIESVEVLKDADATAIYGSRAANGVILITTKTGKAGKIKTEGNFNYGITRISRFFPVLNTEDYIAMRKEALANDGLPYNAQTAPDIFIWDSTRYTNWQKYLWGATGKSVTAGITVSGGDKINSFRISGNYQSRSDLLATEGHNRRGGLSFNINHRSLNNKFALSLSGIYTNTGIDTKQNPSGINIAPNAPSVFDDAGKLNYSGWGPLRGVFPFTRLLQGYSAQTEYLNGNLTLSYEITKGLQARTTLGYNSMQTIQNEKTPIASQDPIYNPSASKKIGNTFVRNLIAEPQLEYVGFLLNGRLNVLAGATYQANNTSSNTLVGNFINNDAQIENISSAQRQTVFNMGNEYKYEAAFGRVNYQLNNRYILNLNMRRDGSSKFGPGRQFGNFASAGAAWIFSESKLMKQLLTFVDFGKIRASYGSTGGDQILNYQYQSSWSFGDVSYNGYPVLFPDRHYDSTIHWQVNKKLELGLNLGFFNERLTLEASWYRNRCNNQLVAFPTPLLTGFSNVLTNSPANVQNTGWEFILNAVVLDRSSLTLKSRLNIGMNRNKLLSYPNIEQSPYAALLAIGYPLSITRVLHSTGVDPQKGTYTFKDVNGNGKTDVDYSNKTKDDRYILDRSPRFEGGFSNSLTYKSWSLDFFFFFKKQTGVKVTSSGIPGGRQNQTTDVLARWQKPGDVTNMAKFTTRPDNTYFLYRNNSDGIYTDASFARLQNLVLSYYISFKDQKKAVGASGCKFYLKGQNLLVITKYKGADPEVQSATTMSIPQIFTGGLTINF